MSQVRLTAKPQPLLPGAAAVKSPDGLLPQVKRPVDSEGEGADLIWSLVTR
ncbi:hypothetical protein KAX17_12235 [Candidatus Bipolaricaulota bacterium]|nr:hypothetical protein [Candidatus Bipolaricaulota bacterium]